MCKNWCKALIFLKKGIILIVNKNDSIFFIADEFKTAQKIAGQVRIELGNRLDLIELIPFTEEVLSELVFLEDKFSLTSDSSIGINAGSVDENERTISCSTLSCRASHSSFFSS